MLIESSFGCPPWQDLRFILFFEGECKQFPNAGGCFSIRNEAGEKLNEGNLWWIAHKWKIWTGKNMPSV